MNNREDNPLKLDNPSQAKVGSKVKIKKVVRDNMDLEDYYYLKKYENRIGVVMERLTSHSGNESYLVEFEHVDRGYFNRDDFIVID